MNGNGAGKDVNFAHPGPLNEPRTFCAPCPVKAIPRASRSGTVAHKEEVDESLRSIDLPSPKIANCFEPVNYKSVYGPPPREKVEKRIVYADVLELQIAPFFFPAFR